jgi:hypothetical protein
MAEVMDRAPKTLTQREHKVLIILAEDARADSRIVWASLESPQMLRRARLSRTQLYEVIGALVAKGCLDLVMAGGRGHVAKYRIPVLSVPENVTLNRAAQCPVNRDTEPLSVPVSGASVSRKPGPLALKGPPVMADLVAPELAERVRDRNGATPPQSLRDHDGPDHDGSDDQQRAIPVTRQSQAADRNAREPCRRCGERPGGNGGRSFCQPCIAEVNEENRQLGERIHKLRAEQEAELEHVRSWTWERLVPPVTGTRRQRETVTVQQHPTGWIANLGFDKADTCNSVFDLGADGYHAFHDPPGNPVIWKCQVRQRRTQGTVYYCDAHLPGEFRPATAVAP